MNQECYENRLELTVPSHPDYMRVVRCLVREMAQIGKFPDADVRGMVLATDEACTNIIKHSYENDYGQKIVVSIFVFPDRMEIKLKDFGKKVDVDEIRPRDLAEVRPGGLGVHIIRETMDEVVYRPVEGAGMELKLVKKRRFTPTCARGGSSGRKQAPDE